MTMGEQGRFFWYAALCMLLSPALFWVAYFRRARSASPERARILVIPIMTRVGDLMCATPVFRALKMRYPHCHLSVLVAKNVAGIVRHNPRIDELIVMNDVPFKGVSGRGRLFLFLFRQRFDYTIALANNPFGSLAALFSGAPVRIKTTVSGRTLAEALTDWWNTERMSYTHGTFLQAHYIRLLAPPGVPYEEPKKEVFVTQSGEEKAEQFLREHNAHQEPLRVGLCVTAGNRIKEWPPERFAELADKLAEGHSARLVFIDSARNAPLVEKVIAMMRMKERAIAATGFSLEELPSLIKRLHLFIAVDTGTIYIAHAQSVPLIDIIGPVEPHEQPPKDAISMQVLPPAPHTPSSFVIARPGSFRARREAVLAVSVDAVYIAAARLWHECYGV